MPEFRVDANVLLNAAARVHVPEKGAAKKLLGGTLDLDDEAVANSFHHAIVLGPLSEAEEVLEESGMEKVLYIHGLYAILLGWSLREMYEEVTRGEEEAPPR